MDALQFWAVPVLLLTMLEGSVWAWGGRFGFRRGQGLALGINAAILILWYAMSRFGFGGPILIFVAAALQGGMSVAYRDRLIRNLPPRQGCPATGFRFAAVLLLSYGIKFAALFLVAVMIAGAIGG